MWGGGGGGGGGVTYKHKLHECHVSSSFFSLFNAAFQEFKLHAYLTLDFYCTCSQGFHPSKRCVVLHCIVLCCIGGKTMINVQTRMQQNAHMKRVLDREVGEIDREVMGTQMNTKSQVRS